MINSSSDEIINELNPTPVETEVEQEGMPSLELLPTSSNEYNADENLPEYEAIEFPVSNIKRFDPDSLITPMLNNYVPRASTIPKTDPEGSVFMASLKTENSIGSYLNRRSSRDASKVDIDQFNFMEHLTPEQMPDLVHYALDMSQEQIDETSLNLAEERKNRAVLEAHPVQSFGTAFVTSGILDPINYLPFGAIYKKAKTASQMAKVVATGFMSAITSTAGQEAIFHNTQLTRTLEESIWNVSVAGLLGGALGTVPHYLGKGYKIDPVLEKKAYDNVMDIMINPDNAGKSVGAARTGTFDDSLADMPEIVKKSMFLSPGVRLASTDYKIGNKFNSLFVENALYTKANTEGQTYGPALETYIKQRKGLTLPHVIEYNNAYYAMLGIESGPTIVKRARGALKKSDMSAAQFAERVSRSLYNDIPDDNPFVNRAASAMRKGFDDSFKPLVEMGYLTGEKGTKTSAGYLTKVANTKKIIEQGGRNAWGDGTYPQAVYDNMKRTQDSLRGYLESRFYKQKYKELTNLEATLKKAKGKGRKTIDEQAAAIKKEIADNAPKYTVDEDGNLWKPVDDYTLKDIALKHVDRILSQEGDKLLNPVLTRFTGTKSLNARTLLVDQEALAEWQMNDPVKLLMMHTRALSPFIEKQQMARRLGYKDFDEMRVALGNELQDEYFARSMNVKKDLLTGVETREPKTGKEAVKELKRFESIKKDMNAVMELLDGTYGASGENTVTSTGFEKFLKGFRDYNYLSMMGNVTIQSWNDVGSIMLRNGVFSTMYNGLVPMLTDMRQISKRDLKALNFGLDSQMGMINQRYMDTEALTTNPNLFTKAIDALKSVYGDLTVFNQWTYFAQNLAMTTSNNHSLDTIHRIARGKKVAKKDRTRLAQLGIREEYFKYIYDQTNKAENKSYNGSLAANWDTWTVTNAFEGDALRDFKAATAKDIDQSVIDPSVADRPLIASKTGLGKSLFQFKSFGFASTNKTLYSAIQRRRDIEVYTGITAMLTMGAMSYVATSLVRGEEPKLDLKTLSLEAIDRSGVLGILMEGIDISQKFGIIPGEGATRYKSRGLVGAMLGPTFGRAEEIVSVGNVIALSVSAWDKNDITTKDVEKFFRLMPLQNISYVMKLNEMAVTQSRDTFNLIENREGF